MEDQQAISLPRLSSNATIVDIIKLYKKESLGTRLFVHARNLLAPLAEIATHVPSSGTLLDVGCGHGLFPTLLAFRCPDLQITGIDPSINKIQVAQRISGSLSNISFSANYLESVRLQYVQTITILDVLCLLDYEKKLELLKNCRQLINPQGVLLLKTNDTHPNWKYTITRAQEWFMTTSGLTMGSGALHFLSCKENQFLLKQAGFDAKIIHLRHWSPYPHVLFIATPFENLANT